MNLHTPSLFQQCDIIEAILGQMVGDRCPYDPTSTDDNLSTTGKAFLLLTLIPSTTSSSCKTTEIEK